MKKEFIVISKVISVISSILFFTSAIIGIVLSCFFMEAINQTYETSSFLSLTVTMLIIESILSFVMSFLSLFWTYSISKHAELNQVHDDNILEIAKTIDDMKKITCSKCGNKVSSSTLFCPHCGNNITEQKNKNYDQI